MKFHLHNFKFQNQIIFVFLIVFMLSSLQSGFAFYQIAKQQMEENFTDTAQEAMHQMEQTLNSRLRMIGEKVESLLINQSFLTVLAQYLNNPTSANTVKAQGMIGDYLKDFERGESLISSSYLHTKFLDFDSYVQGRKKEFDFQESSFAKAIEEMDRATVWLKPTKDEIFLKEDIVIPTIRRFTGIDPREWQYFIYQINQKRLKELIMGQHSFFDDVIIIDEMGNKILGETEISIEELLDLSKREDLVESKIISNKNISYLVQESDISASGWKVYGLKSRETMLSNLGKLRRDILQRIVIVFIVGFILMYIISGQMTRALKQLEKKMKQVREGNFEVALDYPYNDEVGSLSRSFEYMIKELEFLIEKQEKNIRDLKQEKELVGKIQKQKRKAELNALQAQIQPHFLYNTLNTITWQATDKGLDDVSLMANALGKFFRLSLSKGAEQITLADEVDHIQYYLMIQSVRYQDRLQYEINLPKKLEECMVIKLILQPLIENAIYHGIKEKKNMGKILIEASKINKSGLDVLQLKVWDNGVGIPSQKLKRMNRELKSGVRSSKQGYGSYNVNERIRLYYGELYGLYYESEEGKFTQAIVTIPLQFREENSDV